MGALYAKHVPSLLRLTERFWFYFFLLDYICFSVFLMAAFWVDWPFVEVTKGFLRYGFADMSHLYHSDFFHPAHVCNWYSFVALWDLYAM